VKGEQAGEMSGVGTFQTPCGLTISHVNEAETEFVYKEIFRDRVYLQHGISLHDGDCVFDVGANIGLFTMFVQEHFPGVRVFAFEPSPEVFPILESNTAKYGENVVALPCGISDETGEAVFTSYPSYSIISGFHANADADTETVRLGILNQWRERFPGQQDPAEPFLDALVQNALRDKKEHVCQLRTISEIARETGVPEISLLKVDAEGSELDVLLGIVPDDWPKIRQVVLEIHGAQSAKLPRIREILETEGFRCVFEEETALRGTGIVNCYACRA
jgi:FkbM family methyltransferase